MEHPVAGTVDEKEEDQFAENPVSVEGLQGNVEFEHVHFGYNPEHIIINDFSAKVKEGQKATITFAGQTYEGTVTKISRIATTGATGGNNQAATSTAITATVHIDNPDSNIFLGVEAKVSIHAAEAKDVVILPTEAVNIGKDGSFCWVCEDGVLAKRSIETGVTSDDCAEITKGLKEGEEVITDPGDNEEGDPITTITAGTEAE